MRDGVPVVTDARVDERVWPSLKEAVDVGPVFYVPLGSADEALGTLIVGRRSDRVGFADDVLRLVESFAAQATVAIRLGNSAADRELVAVLGDRDRIARDLHDLVIQRLFATGMALEGAVRGITPPEAADRIRRAIDDLDATIREIRTSIFALQSPAPAAGEGLRTAVLQATRAATESLGFEPEVVFRGPVDTLVPGPIAEQLLAVVREALSNAARHAAASSVIVTVEAEPDVVCLTVTDDGKGLAPGGRRSGLANLARRARDLGGSFDARPGDDGGTVVEWRVPIVDD